MKLHPRIQRIYQSLKEHTFLLLIFPLAVLVRLFKLGEKQLWLDEILQALHTSKGSLSQVLKAATTDRGAAPLDYVIQHLTISTFGRSAFAARIHAATFGIIAVVVLYYLARRLAGTRVANLATLLYAVFPLHVWYSQEGRPYSLFDLMTLCSYTAFYELLVKRRARNWLYFAAISVVMVYTDYYGAIVLLCQGVFLCLLWSERIRNSLAEMPSVGFRFLVRFVGLVAICFGLLLPWLLFAFSTVYDFHPTPERFNGWLALRILKELSYSGYPLSILLLVIAFLGVKRLRQQKKDGQALLLLTWFVIPFPVILFILWREQYFFAIRQILFTTPALFILIGHGILRLKEYYAAKVSNARGLAVAGFACVLVFSISVSTIIYHMPDRREDIRGAAHYLRNHVSNESIVMAPGIGELLSYYFPRISAYSVPLLPPQKSCSAILSGRTAYVVESRYMKPMQADAIKRLSQLAACQTPINFRGIQIIILTTGDSSGRCPPGARN